MGHDDTRRPLESFLQAYVERTLNAYAAQPARIEEDAHAEAQWLSGGYGHRQLYELIQNGADAIQEKGGIGHIAVVLTQDCLYCANEGAPVTEAGIRALLGAHLSAKKDDEIGRFGLGFKSVLGVCDTPDIVSDTVSFRFNPSDLAKQMRQLVAPETPLPRLRTAAILNMQEHLDADETLASLKKWAATVVRLRLKPGAAQRLLEDIRSFPAEFLVFSPHVRQLHLRALEPKIDRLVSVEETESTIHVTDGGEKTSWTVFRTTIRTTDLSEEARNDMDSELRKRMTLPLTWAALLGTTTRKRQHLWAFFPTQDETTLQVILNAPWKTDSFREKLLRGAFNGEMLRRSATLVAQHIDALNTRIDPARFLDALPAQDDVGWADRVLNEAVYAALQQSKCMPSTSGAARVPKELSLRPPIARGAHLDGWFIEHGSHEPDILVHRTAETGIRSKRASPLGCGQMDLRTWLGALLTKPTPAKSIAVIRLAGLILDSKERTAGDEYLLKLSAIVLTKDNRLVVPDKDTLSFPDGNEDAVTAHENLVHPDVASDPEARHILADRFGISAVSDEAVFRAFLSRSGSNIDWVRFWTLSRKLDAETARRVFVPLWSWPSFRPEVRARAQSGCFKPLSQLLLPGPITSTPVNDDVKAATIDTTYHSDDLNLLREFGAVASPTECQVATGSLWDSYRETADVYFRTECNHRKYSTPQAGYVAFIQAKHMAPLDPIETLRNDAAVRMTNALLPCALANPGCTLVHRTRPDAYPQVPYVGFVAWVLKRHGWVRTSRGPMPAAASVGPSLGNLASFLPVADCDAPAAVLFSLPSDVDALTQSHWGMALAAASAFAGDEATLTSFYALTSRHSEDAPATLRCRLENGWTTRPPSQIYITSDRSEADVLQRQGQPALFAPRQSVADSLVSRWSLRQTARSELRFAATQERGRAIDRLALLRDQSGFPADISLQSCDALWLELRSTDAGLSMHPIESSFRDSCLYFTGDRSARWLVDQLAAQIPFPIAGADRIRIAAAADDAATQERLASIREHESLDAKLVAAIGIGPLRAGIPQRHMQWLEAHGEYSELDVARLAHSVHGVEVLKAYRDALASKGLRPPERWAGSPTAAAFVRDLGFPAEYAGFPGQGRQPWDDVLGPVQLPELHDFQKTMRDELLQSIKDTQPSRGILSLPTGAGKTRIAVQAIIEWAKEREAPATVLWIAQSDELCEQSVESWSQAWRSIGPNNGKLRINRLWGTTNEKVRPPESGTCLVVATFQSLLNRLDRPDFVWIWSPDVVVIDEAHGATETSYTRILAKLGLDQYHTARPLIGLTATPFRGGADERETWRLAFRFEHRRFDLGFGEIKELYRHLQSLGVLAYADHAEPLEGETITLSPEQQSSLDRFKVLPGAAEIALGRMEARNRRILEHIGNQPADWPILVFAASVEHAEDLAVRLNMRGISACAISGDTAAGRRRHAIAAFKRKEIRVLTNYGVLTTGFDAPAVRALYVTRPVYSPGLYQQMIGRGLRGPANGGTPRCLIVNVKDNIAQYGHDLAFHQFEWIWRLNH